MALIESHSFKGRLYIYNRSPHQPQIPLSWSSDQQTAAENNGATSSVITVRDKTEGQRHRNEARHTIAPGLAVQSPLLKQGLASISNSGACYAIITQRTLRLRPKDIRMKYPPETHEISHQNGGEKNCSNNGLPNRTPRFRSRDAPPASGAGKKKKHG